MTKKRYNDASERSHLIRNCGLFSVLIAVISITFQAGIATAQDQRSGPYFSYESTFFKPYFSRDDAFLLERANNNDVTVESFKWDFEHAPRYELGYFLPGCNIGVRARYWSMDSNASRNYFQAGGNTFQAFARANQNPNITVGTNTNRRNLVTTRDLDLDTFDFEVMNRIDTEKSTFLWGGGLRHANIQHQYAARVFDNAGVLQQGVQISNGFEGFGPTIFAEGSRKIGDTNFSLFAGGRGSLLFGDTHYDILDLDAANTRAQLDDYSILPIIESQLGIRYDAPDLFKGHLSVSAAVEGQYWFNAGTGFIGPTGNQNVGSAQSDERDADMGLIGGVLKLEYEFADHINSSPSISGGKRGKMFHDSIESREGPYFSYESTFFKPYFTRDDAFQVEQGDPNLIRTESFEWDFEHASRYEVGYNLPGCNVGVRARYWSMDVGTKASYTQGAGDTQAFVQANQIPNIEVRTDAQGEVLSVNRELDLDTFDFEAISRLDLSRGSFAWGGGLRHASIQHLYSASNPDGNGGRNGAQITNGLDGFGPTLFAEASHQIGCSNFSIFAGGRGSLIFGESNYSIRDLDGSANNHLADDYSILPILESQIGVRYDAPDFLSGKLSVSAAVEGQYWINSGTGYIGPTGSSPQGASQSDERDADMGLIGGVLKVEYEFGDRFNFPHSGGKGGIAAVEKQAGPYLNIENTYMQPYFSRDDAFQVGDTQTVGFDWDYDYAPRFELGYFLPDCNIGIRGRYWQLDSSAGATAANASVQAGRSPDIAVAGALSARHDLEMDAYEIEGMIRHDWCGASTTWGGGLRYSEIQHNYLATDGAGDGVQIENRFRGFGPTLFAEGTRRIGCSPFSFFASGRGSLLFGDTSLAIRDLGTADRARDEDYTVLPVFESQLGIRYDVPRFLSMNGNLSVSAAVEGQYWVNGGTGYIGPTGGSISGAEQSDERDADTGLIGGVLKVSYDF